MTQQEQNNKALWNKLAEHWGHNVCIVKYGDPDDPANISIECEDCGEVVLDAELYTICARVEEQDDFSEVPANLADEISAEIETLRADAKKTWETGEADRYEARADALEWVLGRLTGRDIPRSWAHH